ncbi:3-deoxy-manno-octulosonate cytidylyltransferase [Candidatus Dependentiae bacterium]|nr:3-deoxy-manno-octulosonate cytidylyltransferase [Candidatus Dependentiae bacterium]
MFGSKRVVCIIPARLASTRFPQKLLHNLCDKPILQWVFEAARSVSSFDDVVFAVDAQQTFDLVRSFGGKAIMTSPDCQSGTDRLIEVVYSKKYIADIWVNWQGDEPFITEKMIQQLLATCETDDTDVWTLKKKIKFSADIASASIAKVVCDANDFAIYFSRNAIPFYREDSIEERCYYKHVGLYAYTTKALETIASLGASDLEEAEKLEQLRFLQNRMKIKVHETDQEVVGIDTPQDLVKAELIAKNTSL